MTKSIRGTPKKKRGRPRTTGKGTQIGMRWHEEDLSAIDTWRKQQDGEVDRAEAIRRLVRRSLAVEMPKARPKHK